MTGIGRLARVGAAVLVAAILILALIPASTPEIEGDDTIALLEPVEIGGVDQWLLLRGESTANPVLLFVHGGPGMTFIPSARQFGDILEEEFVVVHWDQRGAGKSCSDDVPAESMKVERFVDDLIEVADHLRERFDEEKIFLVGHSWGSVIGAMAARKAPDRFHVYVGSGQVVDMRRGEALSHEWVTARAREEGNEAALEDLERVKPPYERSEDLALQRQWLGHYGGDQRGGRAMVEWVGAVFTASEYTLADRLAYYGCVMSSLDHLWTSFGDLNFFESIPRLELPGRLFLGRHDWTVPAQLAAEWAGGLSAPSVGIVWFEESAHLAMLEESERYQLELGALRKLAR